MDAVEGSEERNIDKPRQQWVEVSSDLDWTGREWRTKNNGGEIILEHITVRVGNRTIRVGDGR